MAFNFSSIGKGLAGLGDTLFGRADTTKAGMSDIYNSTRGATTGLLGGALDFLNTNKAGIGALGGLAGNYLDYQANKDMASLANRQLGLTEAERQRQIDKEKEGQLALAGGFGRSGLASSGVA